MSNTRKLGGLAGREAEHHAGERLKNEILRAVGQHRDKDKDREAPRFWFRPDFQECFRKVDFGGSFRVGCWTGVTVRPSMPQTPANVRTIAATDTQPETTMSRSGENGSSI